MALFSFRRPAVPLADTVRMSARRSAQFDAYLAELIGDDEPGLALAVIKAGEPVHRAGYGLADLGSRAEVTPRTPFHMASCGKQFTGLGLLMLAEEKRGFGLDDPIGRHIPELVGYGREVTIRRLLHHLSGIRDLYDDRGVAAVLKCAARPTNAHVVQTYVAQGCPMSAVRCRPGDRQVYSNSGYDLLGTVIESVSGQSYAEFFRSRVFEPLGMTDTFSGPDAARMADPRRAIGYEIVDGEFVAQDGSAYDDIVGSGSFVSTVYDLTLYDRALAANALVSAASMQVAVASGVTNGGEPTGYGFGWALGSDRCGRFAEHQGEWTGFFAHICRYLDQPLSIYVLSNRPGLNMVELVELIRDAFA